MILWVSWVPNALHPIPCESLQDFPFSSPTLVLKESPPPFLTSLFLDFEVAIPSLVLRAAILASVLVCLAAGLMPCCSQSMNLHLLLPSHGTPGFLGVLHAFSPSRCSGAFCLAYYHHPMWWGCKVCTSSQSWPHLFHQHVKQGTSSNIPSNTICAHSMLWFTLVWMTWQYASSSMQITTSLAACDNDYFCPLQIN